MHMVFIPNNLAPGVEVSWQAACVVVVVAGQHPHSRSAAMFSFLSLPNAQAFLLCSILLFNLGMSVFRIWKQILK